ncbi:hypothetical protein BGZ54_009733, partial [Gamsiella multidivaricata]
RDPLVWPRAAYIPAVNSTSNLDIRTKAQIRPLAQRRWSVLCGKISLKFPGTIVFGTI